MAQTLRLSDLDGQWVDGYEIQVESKPFPHRQGWTHFCLYLMDRERRITCQSASGDRYATTPVLEGIHSGGGRGVKGWIEIGEYFPSVYFSGDEGPVSALTLSKEKIDQKIFQLLSETVPPGGHLMFAYEAAHESSFHWETQVCLMKGVPPVCTAPGELLFRTGFRLVKDWYLAEGGHEGPRKLWGEKPSSESDVRTFDLKTFLQLLAFLSRKPPQETDDLERSTRKRALRVLGDLCLDRSLSGLAEDVGQVHDDPSGRDGLREASHLVCQEVIRFVHGSALQDGHTKGKLREISESCAGPE